MNDANYILFIYARVIKIDAGRNYFLNLLKPPTRKLKKSIEMLIPFRDDKIAVYRQPLHDAA